MARANDPRWSNRVFRKVVVALATGFIAYFLAQLIDDQDAFGVGLALFMSGVVFVVQYLVDVEARLDTFSDKLDDGPAPQRR